MGPIVRGWVPGSVFLLPPLLTFWLWDFLPTSRVFWAGKMRSCLALVVHMKICPSCCRPSEEIGPHGTDRPFGSGPALWGQTSGWPCSLPLDEQRLLLHRPPLLICFISMGYSVTLGTVYLFMLPTYSRRFIFKAKTVSAFTRKNKDPCTEHHPHLPNSEIVNLHF